MLLFIEELFRITTMKKEQKKNIHSIKINTYLGSSQIETESSQFSHLYKNIDIYFLKNIYLQYRKRTCIQYNPH